MGEKWDEDGAINNKHMEMVVKLLFGRIDSGKEHN